MSERGIWQWLEEEMERQKGQVSCLYRNLENGESFGVRPALVHPSASVIKIFLMAYIFELERAGKLSMTDRLRAGGEENASSSGILHFLRDVSDMSVRDLVELMIIVSDNTATNILLRAAGMEQVQAYLREELKLAGTSWEREMMDLDAISRGIQNHTSASDCAWFFEQLYRGKLVSPEASGQMLRILKEQQFNDLIPDYLCGLIPEESVAHKSGGLEGVVHDAGIVDYGKAPFILCFFGSETDVPAYTRLIREASLRIYRHVNGMDG